MAAEPREGCHRLSLDLFFPLCWWFPIFLFSYHYLGLYERCFRWNLVFYAVVGAVFAVGGTVCAGGLLVVVFSRRLWQPWRASIFRAARPCLSDRRRRLLRPTSFLHKKKNIYIYIFIYCYGVFFLQYFIRGGILRPRNTVKCNLIVHL